MWFAAAAWACDDAVLRRLEAPAALGREPVVVTGSAATPEVQLAGALVAFRSRWPVSAWQPVLTRPEDGDEWQPEELGTARVERIDPTHIFQAMDARALFLRFRRQLVVRIDWRQLGDRLENCWEALDPAPWRARTAAWETGAPWQTVGLGGWRVEPTPSGGARVSYQLWTEATLLPAKVQAWATGRTLPAMARAYEARVGELYRPASGE